MDLTTQLDNFFKKDEFYLISIIKSKSELDFRQYIEKRGNRLSEEIDYFLIKGFETLWPFFTNDHFIAIHCNIDLNLTIKSSLNNEKILDKHDLKKILLDCDLVIGILTKPSLNSKRSYLETVPILLEKAKYLTKRIRLGSQQIKKTKKIKKLSFGDSKELIKNWSQKLENAIKNEKKINKEIYVVKRKGENSKKPKNKIEPINSHEQENNISKEIDLTIEKSTRAPSTSKLDLTTPEPKFGPLTREETFIDKIMKTPGKNFNTITLKTEAYVDQENWKAMKSNSKRVLTTWIHLFKKKLDSLMFSWSLIRDENNQNITNSKVFFDSLKNIKKITFKQNIKNQNTQKFQNVKKFSELNFDLDKLKKYSLQRNTQPFLEKFFGKYKFTKSRL